MTEDRATGAVVRWQDIPPARRAGLDLTERRDITAPLTQDGERCPWPWDPEGRTGVPMGMYHCPYCGEMVLAGVEHPDYAGFDEDYARFAENEMDALDYRDQEDKPWNA